MVGYLVVGGADGLDFSFLVGDEGLERGEVGVLLPRAVDVDAARGSSVCILEDNGERRDVQDGAECLDVSLGGVGGEGKELLELTLDLLRRELDSACAWNSSSGSSRSSRSSSRSGSSASVGRIGGQRRSGGPPRRSTGGHSRAVRLWSESGEVCLAPC